MHLQTLLHIIPSSFSFTQNTILIYTEYNPLLHRIQSSTKSPFIIVNTLKNACYHKGSVQTLSENSCPNSTTDINNWHLVCLICHCSMHLFFHTRTTHTHTHTRTHTLSLALSLSHTHSYTHTHYII